MTRLVTLRALEVRPGLWVAWTEEVDPLVAALGQSETEALTAVKDELERQWDLKGEYVGTAHG